MWRLVPLLAVLGFLEVLVPWPDVAALVLSDTHRAADTRVVSLHGAVPSVETPPDRSQLIVQVRDTAN